MTSSARFVASSGATRFRDLYPFMDESFFDRFSGQQLPSVSNDECQGQLLRQRNQALDLGTYGCTQSIN